MVDRRNAFGLAHDVQFGRKVDRANGVGGQLANEYTARGTYGASRNRPQGATHMAGVALFERPKPYAPPFRLPSTWHNPTEAALERLRRGDRYAVVMQVRLNGEDMNVVVRQGTKASCLAHELEYRKICRAVNEYAAEDYQQRGGNLLEALEWASASESVVDVAVMSQDHALAIGALEVVLDAPKGAPPKFERDIVAERKALKEPPPPPKAPRLQQPIQAPTIRPELPPWIIARATCAYAYGR
jgi:hypothetical protein